jgi:hypothetical protein
MSSMAADSSPSIRIADFGLSSRKQPSGSAPLRYLKYLFLWPPLLMIRPGSMGVLLSSYFFVTSCEIGQRVL